MFDPTILIDLVACFAGFATLGFVIAEIIGLYITRSSQNSIVQTTTTGINAIVSVTTLGVTASQAGAVTEVSAIPTQITTPERPKA
jgi:p-aminobenzoyl-glutamate transporter AbgT